MNNPWDDPLSLLESARQDAARLRGRARTGDHERASESLDRACDALRRAEAVAPDWMAPAIALVQSELDAAIEAA